MKNLAMRTLPSPVTSGVKGTIWLSLWFSERRSHLRAMSSMVWGGVGYGSGVVCGEGRSVGCVCERGGQEIDGLKKVKVPLERGKEPIRR